MIGIGILESKVIAGGFDISGLVSYYRFEGDATDELGVNDGTADPGITYSNTSPLGDESVYDGSSRINLQNDASIHLDDMSYSFYIKQKSSAGFNGSCGRIGEWGVWSNALVIQSWSYGAVIGSRSTTETLTLNGWEHVVVTFDDGGAVQFYLNGTLLVTAMTSSSRTVTGNNFYLGWMGGGFGTLELAGFGIWNTVLNQSEVTSIYNTQSGGTHLV